MMSMSESLIGIESHSISEVYGIFLIAENCHRMTDGSGDMDRNDYGLSGVIRTPVLLGAEVALAVSGR